MRRYISVVVVVVGFGLVGCGGSGGGGTVTGGGSCATDSLAVTVSGLPDGVSAKVTVNGALDLSNLFGSETLKLATGMYTITANSRLLAQSRPRS